MIDHNEVASHYARSNLLTLIAEGVEKLGKTPQNVTIEDLAPVDEFHIGGTLATQSFLDQVAISPEDHVLDVGCGIGGTSRFVAETYGCKVTGIDLTQDYIETGRELCAWVRLDDRVDLIQGNALATGFEADAFDKVFMLHVGMNIADKHALAAEAWRVLKPHGVFGIYDIMRLSNEPLVFPVPWATNPSESSLASPAKYKEALTEAGFIIETERDRRGFALQFFEGMQKKMQDASGPPPLGLHLLMGASTQTKLKNMINNVIQERIAPTELIARKPG